MNTILLKGGKTQGMWCNDFPFNFSFTIWISVLEATFFHDAVIMGWNLLTLCFEYLLWWGRSLTPQERRYGRERSYSRSPAAYNGSRSRSQSPIREPAPPYNGSRSPIRERSLVRGRSSRSPPVRGRSSRSPSRSRSPNPAGYPRERERDESPSQWSVLNETTIWCRFCQIPDSVAYSVWIG